MKASYNKWKIVWTGWKKDISCINLFGQWLAFHPDRQEIVYSSNPGVVGILHGCLDCMNVSIQKDQDPVTDQTSAAERELQKQLTFAKLINFLEEYDRQPMVSEDAGGGNPGRSIQDGIKG